MIAPSGFHFDCPKCGAPLQVSDDALACGTHTFPVTAGVPRFVESAGYTDNFSFQWNTYAKTQIDHDAIQQSSRRLWLESGWQPNDLKGLHVLEVGSGAGRFTSILMNESECHLTSVDYSDAVLANRANNQRHIDAGRLLLGQASVYELPCNPRKYDRVICLGVLQHTPDFRESVRQLFERVRPGGELVVDFYPIKGWYTKLSAKYLLRPLTRRISPSVLHKVVRATIPYSLFAYRALVKLDLRPLTRFVPICDVDSTLPHGMRRSELLEWCALDTFDMFSPAFDNPQRISTVARWLEEFGATVTFADFVEVEPGNRAAAVRVLRPDSETASARDMPR